MAANTLSYAQLLETNNLLQNVGDETYFLCVTRTVQESKLFPVSAYMLMSYLNCFYRYPSLLKKIEASMPAEAIGDRVRNIGIKALTIGVAWTMPGFYLLGREMLINMGMVRPQDAVDDVVYVMDFWKRFQLSVHRNDCHITNKEAGHRAQFLPESTLQVFHGDLYPCEEGDALHTAANKFMAAAAQYGFLVACESRICMTTHGPYGLGDNRELIVRNFFDLAEYSVPWNDGVAAEVPFNSFTVPTAVKDTHFYLVDDWGSFEARPEYKAENVVGVGLYTSDILSDGYLPVGMGSREELTQTFENLARIMGETNTKLWKRFAGWSRNQLLDAGALTYYACIRDFAHVAGVYEVDDWMKIDERAERFRGLLNDEYSNELLGHLLVPLTLPSAQVQEYTLMQHANAPKRVYTPFSYALLDGSEPYVPSVGGMRPGASHLPEKLDRYRTHLGVLPLAELNRRVKECKPNLFSDQLRFKDETWLKYHYNSPLAEQMYTHEQRLSRHLKGKGAGLQRADVDALFKGG